MSPTDGKSHLHHLVYKPQGVFLQSVWFTLFYLLSVPQQSADLSGLTQYDPTQPFSSLMHPACSQCPLPGIPLRLCHSSVQKHLHSARCLWTTDGVPLWWLGVSHHSPGTFSRAHQAVTAGDYSSRFPWLAPNHLLKVLFTIHYKPRILEFLPFSKNSIYLYLTPNMYTV